MEKKELIEAVEGIKEGRDQYVTYLYEEYYKDVYNVCLYMLKNEQDAKDLTSDTFIKAFEKIGQLNNPENFRSWIISIANTTSLNYLKRGKIIQFTSIEEEENIEDIPDESIKSPEKAAIDNEVSEILLKAINKLPEEQRICVFMFYYENYSVREIAEYMQCSENTIRGRLRYANDNLKKSIENLGDEGIRLRSIAALPFLYVILKAHCAKAMETVIPSETDMVAGKIVTEMTKSAKLAETAKTAGKVTAKMVKGKIIGIIAGVAVCATAAVVGINVSKNKSGNSKTNESGIDVLRDENISGDNDSKVNLSDFETEECDDGTISIIKYIGSAEVVNIPNEIEGKTVTKIDVRSFEGCRDIKKVVIPDTVTYIEQEAFYDCQSLEEVTIPDSVEKLNIGAFDDCTSLKEINIPNKIVYIDTNLCRGCTSLEKVVIPGNIKEVGRNAFGDCTSLKEVEISEGVEKLDFSFTGCTSLTEVKIPSSMTKISGAFKNCTSLSKMDIPENTQIGDNTFENCTSLVKITLPANYSFYDEMFKGCTSLEEVDYPKEDENLLYRADFVTHNAFEGCTSLKEFYITGNMSEVEYDAFKDCTSLTKVVVARKDTRFKGNPFAGCTNVTIYGPADSTAEEFAKANNIKFVVQ